MIHFLVHEKDDAVGVAVRDLKKGQQAAGVFMDTNRKLAVPVLKDIPLGHKIALRDMKEGDTVIKYGHDIGRVVAPISRGDHVHVHNVKTKRW